MDRNPSSGFTLIELLVTVAIASILLGVGVPSFTSAIKNSRISGQYNDVVSALYLARSEAVKGSTPVTVCARASDASCGDDWSKGILVFVDNAPTESDPEVGVEDEVLMISPELKGDNHIHARATVQGNKGEVDFVRYQPEGNSDWTSGSLYVCDESRGAKFSRSVNVQLTGDIRPARKDSSGYPTDAFGTSTLVKSLCDAAAEADADA